MNERNPNPNRSTVRSRREPQGGAAFLSRAPILIFVVLFGLIFLLFMGLQSCGSAGSSETTNPSQQPQQSTAAPQGSEPGSETHQSPTGALITTEPVRPEPVTTEPVTTVPPTTEAPAGPTMITVDDRYFDDALFLGDSRTDGLFLYSTPGGCKHYPFPATSLNIFKIMEAEDKEQRYGYANTRALLKGMQFGKIYLMFGINECGYATSKYYEAYKSVVDEIRSYQPDALIYIQSTCYVTQKHEANNPVFATANIKEKNEAIKALANDVDIFYLEINDCLNDGTDHLPSDYTGDGVHLKASYYRLWHDYLLEHAVVDAKHPWEANSPEAEGAQVEHP